MQIFAQTCFKAAEMGSNRANSILLISRSRKWKLTRKLARQVLDECILCHTAPAPLSYLESTIKVTFLRVNDLGGDWLDVTQVGVNPTPSLWQSILQAHPGALFAFVCLPPKSCWSCWVLEGMKRRTRWFLEQTLKHCFAQTLHLPFGKIIQVSK